MSIGYLTTHVCGAVVTPTLSHVAVQPRGRQGNGSDSEGFPLIHAHKYDFSPPSTVDSISARAITLACKWYLSELAYCTPALKVSAIGCKCTKKRVMGRLFYGKLKHLRNLRRSVVDGTVVWYVSIKPTPSGVESRRYFCSTCSTCGVEWWTVQCTVYSRTPHYLVLTTAAPRREREMELNATLSAIACVENSVAPPFCSLGVSDVEKIYFVLSSFLAYFFGPHQTETLSPRGKGKNRVVHEWNLSRRPAIAKQVLRLLILGAIKEGNNCEIGSQSLSATVAKFGLIINKPCSARGLTSGRAKRDLDLDPEELLALLTYWENERRNKLQQSRNMYNQYSMMDPDDNSEGENDLVEEDEPRPDGWMDGPVSLPSRHFSAGGEPWGRQRFSDDRRKRFMVSKRRSQDGEMYSLAQLLNGPQRDLATPVFRRYVL
ncbi:hypothetical protein J6590_020205 [Homalodisca vitripennis]|nr:hypothetical protein J6590_020205 [Homalodisca vitripennis]